MTPLPRFHPLPLIIVLCLCTLSCGIWVNNPATAEPKPEKIITQTSTINLDFKFLKALSKDSNHLLDTSDQSITLHVTPLHTTNGETKLPMRRQNSVPKLLQSNSGSATVLRFPLSQLLQNEHLTLAVATANNQKLRVTLETNGNHATALSSLAITGDANAIDISPFSNVALQLLTQATHSEMNDFERQIKATLVNTSGPLATQFKLTDANQMSDALTLAINYLWHRIDGNSISWKKLVSTANIDSQDAQLMQETMQKHREKSAGEKTAIERAKSLAKSNFKAKFELYAAPESLQFIVTTTDDSNDLIIDGICRDSNQNCSLRAAISEANAHHDHPTFVTLPNEKLSLKASIVASTSIYLQGTGHPQSIVTLDANVTTSILVFDDANAAVHLENITFVGNQRYQRSYDSGGLSAKVEALTVRNCRFENHQAPFALAVTANSVVIQDSAFSKNGFDPTKHPVTDANASTFSFPIGSALRLTPPVAATLIDVDNSIFSDNIGDSGAAISINRLFLDRDITTTVNITLSAVTLTNNHAFQNGGGLYVNASRVTTKVEKSQFRGNTVNQREGGAIYSNAQLSVSQSSFIGNTAGLRGSAITHYSREYFRVENCIFADHNKGSESFAPVIYRRHSDADGNFYNSNFDHVTFTNNKGAAFYTRDSNILVRNSILDQDLGCTLVKGTVLLREGNLTRDETCPFADDTSKVATDVKLSPAKSTSDGRSYFALEADSPAINWGKNCQTKDFLEQSRGTEQCDAGAVVYSHP